MKVFLMIVRSRENEEIIICLGKGFCSFSVLLSSVLEVSAGRVDFFFFFPILVMPKVAYFWQNVHYWLGVHKKYFAKELSKQKSVKTNILV